MRGFEIAKGFKDIDFPIRATKNSAGYDLCSCEDVVIPTGEIVLVKTGLKAFMQADEVLQIYARSSLPKKKHLMLANNVGIIDADYYGNPDNDGHIMIMLYNFGTDDVKIEKSERIAQGIFMKYLTVRNDNSKSSRQGGFGSTK